MSGVLHASTTKRVQPSLVDKNNFFYTKLKSTFTCIYVFIYIAEQCFIILYNYIYILSTYQQINYYFLLNKIYYFVLCFFMVSCYIGELLLYDELLYGKALYGEMLLRRAVIWRNAT